LSFIGISHKTVQDGCRALDIKGIASEFARGGALPSPSLLLKSSALIHALTQIDEHLVGVAYLDFNLGSSCSFPFSGFKWALGLVLDANLTYTARIRTAGAVDIGNLRKRSELLQSSQERGNILSDGIFRLF